MRIQEQNQQIMEQVPEDAVGRRVVCDGKLATVRYIGTVPPTTGQCPALCSTAGTKSCLFFFSLGRISP